MKLLPILTLIFLASCSTVHKLTEKTSSSSDSTSVTHIDETASSRHDSSKTFSFDNKYKIYTEYVYDTVPRYITLAGKTDTVIQYVPRKVKVYEEGTRQGTQAATYTNKDTSSKVADNKTEVAKESKTVDTDKTRSGLNFGFWVGLAIFFAVSIPFLWITRKVKKASEAVKDVAEKVETVVDQA